MVINSMPLHMRNNSHHLEPTLMALLATSCVLRLASCEFAMNHHAKQRSDIAPTTIISLERGIKMMHSIKCEGESPTHSYTN